MSHLRRFSSLALAISILIVATPVHANPGGIHRLSLEEDNHIFDLSQYVSIIVDSTEPQRQYVFVELIEREAGILQLRILPATANASYRLLIRQNQEMPTVLHASTSIEGGYSPARASRVDDVYDAYAFDASTLYFFLRERLVTTESASLHPDEPSIHAFDNRLSIAVDAAAVAGEVHVELQRDIELPEPMNGILVSPMYQYDFKNSALLDTSKPISLTIHYDEAFSDFRSKAIHFFDKTSGSWVPLPSYHHVEDHYVTAQIHLSYAPLALIADPVKEDGIASWYGYKGCRCAASRDYPKGTALRVTRLLTGDSVVVTVNDFGPELWTGRLIDLDRTAFAEIGSLGAGLIYVGVEPYD